MRKVQKLLWNSLKFLQSSFTLPFRRTQLLFSLIILSMIVVLYLLFSPNFRVNKMSPSSLKVTINHSTIIGTSNFSPGISLIDGTLKYSWYQNDPAAIDNVKSLIRRATSYENTHIMAWGAPDPWPNPSQAEPSDWSYLDDRLHFILSTNGIPVMTLCEAPWWMKGQLQPDGTTQMLTADDEWSDIAYGSRILDNKMEAWLHLVQRVAERYMAAPYHVRYFQVWNELKGYYNPMTNAYDYTTSPGDPTGSNARHGYTYMYNQVYQRLMHVASTLHIPTNSVKVGGPYVPIETWSSSNQSHPSNIAKAYGIYDQRPMDVVQYWLQHKIGAGFITIDGGNSNRDKQNITDPFTASEKFADVVHWIRSLNPNHYPGAVTLPIWWAEWYTSAHSNVMSTDYYNAVNSYAIIKLIQAGGAVALSWGGTTDPGSYDGLWTMTTTGGGQPLPWYYSYQAFHDYFPPGTPLCQTIVSHPTLLAALASPHTAMLVNKTAQSLSFSMNGKWLTLGPYQVKVGSY